MVQNGGWFNIKLSRQIGLTLNHSGGQRFNIKLSRRQWFNVKPSRDFCIRMQRSLRAPRVYWTLGINHLRITFPAFCAVWRLCSVWSSLLLPYTYNIVTDTTEGAVLHSVHRERLSPGAGRPHRRIRRGVPPDRRTRAKIRPARRCLALRSGGFHVADAAGLASGNLGPVGPQSRRGG